MLLSEVEHKDDNYAELDESLVSPVRLGQFLRARRRDLNLDIWDMVIRSSRQFSPEDIEAFESGRRQPSDAEALLLKSIYAPDTDGVLPRRMRLVLELDRRRLRVGEHSKRFNRRGLQKPDLILERYLKLVYAMRSARSGTRVPLRTADIDTLAQALGLSSDQVASTLNTLMAQTDWTDQLLTRKVVFPALGVLVASTSVGTLVLEPEDGSGAEQMASVAIDWPVDETGEAIGIGGATVDADHDHDHDHGDADGEVLRLSAIDDDDTPVDPSFEALGEEALAMLRYDWETILPEWTVEVKPAREGFLGGTYPSSKRIELYVRADQSAHDLAITLAHEIGHAVDVTLMDDSERNQWREARGLDDRTWFGEPGTSDFATPAGDFAEAFAVWQIDSSDYRSQLGPPPTPPQLELIQELSAP